MAGDEVHILTAIHIPLAAPIRMAGVDGEWADEAAIVGDTTGEDLASALIELLRAGVERDEVVFDGHEMPSCCG